MYFTTIAKYNKTLESIHIYFGNFNDVQDSKDFHYFHASVFTYTFWQFVNQRRYSMR